MRLKVAAFAGAVVVMATPAMAQYGWRGDYGRGSYDAPRGYDRPYEDARPYYAPRPYHDETGISRYEVMEIVRSANLQPVSRPWRAGANFAVHAVDSRGQTVRVLIDAHRGRILAVGPASLPPNAHVAPPPRTEGAAPFDGNEGPPPRPVPNAKAPGVNNRSAAVTPVHPPMPRPRPADAPAPATAVKPAPEAPSTPPSAAPAPPPPETAPPAAAPPAPAPAKEAPFPPVAPLD